MKTDITQALVNEHRHILQVITLLEQTAPTTVAGLNVDWQFYLDCIDFIRSYADRFHHAKEEDVLFAALVKNGMPRDNSPVAAMLMEHDQGRSYIREMETAVLEAKDGIPGREAVIAEKALAYAALLRDHIAKEDDILYPLAELVIPETMREEIVQGYQRAEALSDAIVGQRYWKLIESCELE
ncbi:hemerythrin domain-containing protein [Geobacter pelophilus]|uniref:Hemerythrin domain-containing protein n=1 Tax=Geoanaerobacter pelophilus TaxID=60036 RepID=A0AAW4L0I9_9BACT|nr:hemerythrin domain-containing protein [Geoanaerobacter pelophilus]MBT0664579.1 hemerythrin domain-containing protein [Geoanaerobacter pelophilus]